MVYYKKDMSRISAFSKWLRGIASQKGFESQRQLAIAAGINEATISRIWNETQLPDEVTVGKIAQALNTDAALVMIEAGYTLLGKTSDPQETAEAEYLGGLCAPSSAIISCRRWAAKV